MCTQKFHIQIFAASAHQNKCLKWVLVPDSLNTAYDTSGIYCAVDQAGKAGMEDLFYEFPAQTSGFSETLWFLWAILQ